VAHGPALPGSDHSDCGPKVLKRGFTTSWCAETAVSLQHAGQTLLWLTSVIAGKLNLPFQVTGFWPAFWGAIIVGLVSWLLNMLIGDKRKRDDEPPPVRVVRVR